MKIKISKSQWEGLGNRSIKLANSDEMVKNFIEKARSDSKQYDMPNYEAAPAAISTRLEIALSRLLSDIEHCLSGNEYISPTSEELGASDLLKRISALSKNSKNNIV